MEASDALRPVRDGTEMDIIVTPNSKREGIEGLDGWRKRVVVRVRSPPLDGKANREVVDVMGGLFGVGCSIIRGQTGRQKTVLIPRPVDEVSALLTNVLKQ